jgi:hypothetical protein
MEGILHVENLGVPKQKVQYKVVLVHDFDNDKGGWGADADA